MTEREDGQGESVAPGAAPDTRPRVDGMYRSQAPGDWSSHYLRFYADGRVVAATSNGMVADVSEWLAYERAGLARGVYTTKKNRVRFETSLDAYDIAVTYSGIVEPGGEHMELHSRDSGRSPERRHYWFVPTTFRR